MITTIIKIRAILPWIILAIFDIQDAIETAEREINTLVDIILEGCA